MRSPGFGGVCFTSLHKFSRNKLKGPEATGEFVPQSLDPTLNPAYLSQTGFRIVSELWIDSLSDCRHNWD